MSDEDQYEYEEEYGDCILKQDESVVQAMLEQKEKDLVLAAELGKALLDKNEELERKLEQNSDELNQKIEEIQQEKYALHLKFENLEGEYENTVKELQYDITQLREQLDRNKQDSHVEEKDRLLKIRELTQQNERLQEELQHANQRQLKFDSEIQHLKESRLASLSAKHEGRVEHLQEQIVNLTERKCHLERQLEKMSEEQESLISLLDETQDRVKVIERQKHEQDEEINKKSQEIRELHERNSELNIQLDHMTEKASNSSGHSMTLYNELSQLAGPNDIAMASDSPINPYPPSMFGDEDIECDDDDFLMTSSSPTHLDRPDHCPATDNEKMEEEIVNAYRHLRQICMEIKSQMGDKVEEDLESNLSDGTGSLNGVVLELKDVIHNAIDKSSQTQSVHLQEIDSLQQRVGELEHDLRLCQQSLQELQKQLHQRDVQIQQKSQRMNELNKQVSSQHEDIKQLSNQRDKLQDMMASDKGRPQMYSVMALLRHARRERDAAVDKRYHLEKDLQQAKYEIIVLNHQLMEAIQQKNTVSQLLDQWQADMANLLGVRMEKSLEEFKKDEASGSS